MSMFGNLFGNGKSPAAELEEIEKKLEAAGKPTAKWNLVMEVPKLIARKDVLKFAIAKGEHKDLKKQVGEESKKVAN